MTSPILLDSDAGVFPLSLGSIKDMLGVTNGEFDIRIPEVLAPAALTWAEGVTRRSIVNRTHRWGIRDFPRDGIGAFRLPLGLAQTVTSIAYSLNNSITTLTGPTSSSPEGTGYQEELRSHLGGIVMPPVGGSWPDVDSDVPTPILVTFTAGWLTDDVPGDILDAMVMHIHDNLEVRSAQDMLSTTDLDVKEHKLGRWVLRRWS